MRTTLLKPLGGRRRTRGRRYSSQTIPASLPSATIDASSAADAHHAEADRSPARRARAAHAAAVRSHDRACYGCACGYVFEAGVTTTVSCPHCGAAQAW